MMSISKFKYTAQGTDAVVQMPVAKTDGSVTVLFDAADLSRLEDKGITPEEVVVRVEPNTGKFRSPELVWNVRGTRRVVPLAHLIHGIVGQRRRVKFISRDRRVAGPNLDLRKRYALVGEPGRTRRRRRFSEQVQQSRRPRLEIRSLSSYALVDKDTDAIQESRFDTKADAGAYLERLVRDGYAEAVIGIADLAATSKE
jgi:hypothetical protein